LATVLVRISLIIMLFLDPFSQRPKEIPFVSEAESREKVEGTQAPTGLNHHTNFLFSYRRRTFLILGARSVFRY